MTLFVKEAFPLLNTPRFTDVFGKKLPLDNEGLLRPVELIALPGTPVDILEEHENSIARISHPTYKSSPLYIDTRALEEEAPVKRPFSFEKEKILSVLQDKVGLPYIWGGNWSQGSASVLDWYPPHEGCTEKELALRSFKGLDCSGLLYEACAGNVPRNTSEMMHFGKEVTGPVAPLDLILFPGHVIIVLDKERCIESLHPFGVITSPLQKRLKALPNFIIRRFL